jgi:hypothetical protein
MVYRLSLALLCLYALLLIIMFFRNKVAQVVNEGLFFIKYIAVIAIFIALLFAQNDVFT